MKKIALWSAFSLVVVVLCFLLHPASVWIVRAVNDGESSGCVPSGPNYSGWCWSRPYTRFIPTEYEAATALALDAGLAILCVSGVFYELPMIAKRKRTASTVAVTGKRKRRPTAAKHRLLLIPAWLLAQFVWNLFSGLPAGQALDTMTSIESLWASAVVITVIVLYARNYQVVFGKDPQKPATPEK